MFTELRLGFSVAADETANSSRLRHVSYFAHRSQLRDTRRGLVAPVPGARLRDSVAGAVHLRLSFGEREWSHQEPSRCGTDSATLRLLADKCQRPGRAVWRYIHVERPVTDELRTIVAIDRQLGSGWPNRPTAWCARPSSPPMVDDWSGR